MMGLHVKAGIFVRTKLFIGVFLCAVKFYLFHFIRMSYINATGNWVSFGNRYYIYISSSFQMFIYYSYKCGTWNVFDIRD